MNKIYNNLNVHNLIKTEWLEEHFDYEEQEEIMLELKNNVDVSFYANPEYNLNQMKQIRYGLENDLDVSIYANPEFSVDLMKEVREGLDASWYAKSEITEENMSFIRELVQ